MGAAAAVVLIKERHIVEAFRSAGALSAQKGAVPEEILVEQHGVGWRRLRERSVIRETSPGSGRFYLDAEVWESLRRMRSRLPLVRGLIVLVVSVVVIMSKRPAP